MADEIFEVQDIRSERSLRDLYSVLFRHKWKMLLFFCFVFITVAVVTFCSDEIYRSEARLLVRLGRETVTLDPTATTGPIIPVVQSRENEMATELEILKSREIAEKVVDSIGLGSFIQSDRTKKNLLQRLNLATHLSDRDEAVKQIMNNLDVETQRNSWIISVSYNATSSKLAQDVLSKIIDFYMEKHVVVHQTPGSYQFFVEQAERLRGNLTSAENKLRDLQNTTGIFSLTEQQRILLGRIGALETEIDSAESDLASSRAKVQELEKKLAITPELVVTAATVGNPNAAADTMRARLYELQLTEQDLVSKFEPESRQIQDVRQQIAAAQALLDKENQARSTLTKGINTTYQGMQSAFFGEQANLLSVQARLEMLKKKLTEAQTQLKTQSDNGFKVTTLSREIGMQEANYRKYSESLEEARIDHALETGKISNISVMQPAFLPIEPIPRKLFNLLLGFLVGIFGAVGIAFASEYLDHSIRTPDEAEERLHLPTLACIPRVRTNRISSAQKWDIPSKVKGQYELLKEHLLLGSGVSGQASRVFAIIGSHYREGASTIAANLAAALAIGGDEQVLLIDADLSNPSVHKIFESRLSPGLANILANGHTNEEVIISSPVHNLSLLAAGVVEGDVSEVIDDGFAKLLESVKKNYRFVVIDMPALNEASWSLRLARLCDGVGLVVEAEQSRWEVVQRTKELLTKSNANVLGVVVNKRRYYIPKWLYRTL
jgi:capsular exopolysaccharide synthesis family protein